MAKKSRIWNFFDGLKGDKVVWMIVLILIMWSVVCIFSSTSTTREVMSGAKTRVDVVRELMLIVGLGVGLLVFCCVVIKPKGYKFLAAFGFALSAVLLVFVNCHLKLGSAIQAGQINGAWRVIKIGGLQLHIYEVIKVAMVMYLAWAVDTFVNKDFRVLSWLARHEHFKWLGKPGWQKTIMIYFPMFFVVSMVALGSGSSAAFIGLIMLVTVLVGGLKIKEIVMPGVVLVVLVGGILLANRISDGRLLENTRAATWVSRFKGTKEAERAFSNAEKNSVEYYAALDKIRQPYSAKIALKQGGIFGKGAGQSTQRYIVPVMYEDYMFSFIVEEYGLFGAVVIIILYLALIARGSVIARNSKDNFGKITVAGLVLLISGQAMLHMLVNVNCGPLTGQTLPLISYGASSFIVFCIAFGVILSISRDAARNISRESRNAVPIKMIHGSDDRVRDDLDVLDEFESDL